MRVASGSVLIKDKKDINIYFIMSFHFDLIKQNKNQYQSFKTYPFWHYCLNLSIGYQLAR